MKNRMRTYILLFILLLTVVIACRKDKPSPVSNNSECSEFDNLPSLTYFANSRFQYQTPYFNPNNPNEFVYNYKDFDLDEYKLIKYNVQTSVKTLLAENVKIISQPKWSRKGWIAFDNVFNQNYQMWIIKDNGDSLKQLTSSIANLFPVWDAVGDDLYWQHSPVLGVPYYFFKQGLYNSIVDTVLRDGDANNGYAGYSEVSINNILLTNTFINNQSHLAISNLSQISFTSLFNVNQAFSTDYIRGLTWSNNSQTAYFTVYNDGLYQLDINTGNYTKLMVFCDSKRYTKISCSPDGTRLIGERIDSYLEKNSNGSPTGKIIENSNIYLIDLQTLKETKINLE
tara:strand:- start:10082 stop:11104 length:1023 start_codon:yes stop_codon:yes gene_type:complete